jgi:hypothetical protein
MSRRISLRLATFTSVLVMLGVLLALSSPPASASSPYCGGQRISNYGFCYGAARYLSQVAGYGDQRSVCVGIAGVSGTCSSGPRQIAVFNWGSVIWTNPYIQDNAASWTIIHGTAY